MAIVVKTSIKSNFETGDKPTQTDFEELIDQSIPNWFEDQNIQVDGGTAGIYEVQSTASATARPVGAVGAQLLSVAATASAADILTGSLSVLATEQATTSGTEIDFTSIPSWVKKITIMLTGVSTNGTSSMIIQIGDSGGIETTGYLGAVGVINTATAAAAAANNGFAITNNSVAAGLYNGVCELSLEDSANNTWCGKSNITRSDSGSAHYGAASKSLTGTLDRIRLTTSGGANTFDAGAINIQYQ